MSWVEVYVPVGNSKSHVYGTASRNIVMVLHIYELCVLVVSINRYRYIDSSDTKS